MLSAEETREQKNDVRRLRRIWSKWKKSSVGPQPTRNDDPRSITMVDMLHSRTWQTCLLEKGKINRLGMILARCPSQWCPNDGKIVQLKALICQVQTIDQDASFCKVPRVKYLVLSKCGTKYQKVGLNTNLNWINNSKI